MQGVPLASPRRRSRSLRHRTYLLSEYRLSVGYTRRGPPPSPPERRIPPPPLPLVARLPHARVGAPGGVGECLVVGERRFAGGQAGGEGGEEAVGGDGVEGHGGVADGQPAVTAGAVEAGASGVDAAGRRRQDIATGGDPRLRQRRRSKRARFVGNQHHGEP